MKEIKTPKELMNLSSKEILSEELKPHLIGLGKNLNSFSFEERYVIVKQFSKILVKGEDDISKQIREIIYNSMEEHFKKSKFYFHHVPQHKKVSELRQIAKLIPKDKIENVATVMLNAVD